MGIYFERLVHVLVPWTSQLRAGPSLSSNVRIQQQADVEGLMGELHLEGDSLEPNPRGFRCSCGAYRGYRGVVRIAREAGAVRRSRLRPRE